MKTPTLVMFTMPGTRYWAAGFLGLGTMEPSPPKMMEPGVSADPKVTLAVAAGMKVVAMIATPAMPVIANSDLNMDPLVFVEDDMRWGVVGREV